MRISKTPAPSSYILTLLSSLLLNTIVCNQYYQSVSFLKNMAYTGKSSNSFHLLCWL